MFALDGIPLDRETKSLIVELTGAGAIPFYSGYVDLIGQTKTDFSAYRPAANDGDTNGTSEVTLVAAPNQGTVRIVNFLSIHNDSGGDLTVIVSIDKSGTNIPLVELTIADTESLSWTPSVGWKIITGGYIAGFDYP